MCGVTPHSPNVTYYSSLTCLLFLSVPAAKYKVENLCAQ